MNLRYQGGKSRIAKELSEFLTPPRARVGLREPVLWGLHRREQDHGI